MCKSHFMYKAIGALVFCYNICMQKVHRTYQHRASSPGRRWHTIELANLNETSVCSGCAACNYYCAIRIKGLPEIRLRKGLALPEGVPKALSVMLRGRRLFINLTYEVELAALPGKRCRCRDRHGRVRQAGVLRTRERVGRRRKANKQLARMQRRLSACLSCKKGGHRWEARRAVLANHQHQRAGPQPQRVPSASQPTWCAASA